MWLSLIHPLLASDVTITDLFHYISQGGILGLLCLILIGGYKKWWVWGWNLVDSETRLAQAQKERDDWRDLALHGTNLAEQTVDLFRNSRKE